MKAFGEENDCIRSVSLTVDPDTVGALDVSVSLAQDLWVESLPDQVSAGCCWASAGCFTSLGTFGSCASTSTSASSASCAC